MTQKPSNKKKKTKQNKARVQWKKTIDLAKVVQTKKCIAIANRGNPKEISSTEEKELQREFQINLRTNEKQP